MDPSQPPLLPNSSSNPFDDGFPSPHSNTVLNDLFIFEDDLMHSSVAPAQEDCPLPHMEPLLLPRSQAVPNPEQLSNLPTPQPNQPPPQPAPQPGTHPPPIPQLTTSSPRDPRITSQTAPAPVLIAVRAPQLPTTSPYVAPNASQCPHPIRIAPRTPLPQTTSPHLRNTPVRTPATPILPRTPLRPTPYASPMSIATPLTLYPTTPQTTPVLHPPLTPVTPVSEHVAIFSAAIGDLPDDRVDSYFDAATDRAWAVANEKKIELRERLKRTPTQAVSRSKRSSQREARVSRAKDKEYRLAMEHELKEHIHCVCVLLEYIERFLPGEVENARKRTRTD